jgi:hypothetical protein
MKEKIKSVLIEMAKNSKTMSYSELAKKIGVKLQPGGFGNEFYNALIKIGDEELLTGRPLINSLVVRVDDKLPGNRFFEWVKQKAKAYHHLKSKKEIIKKIHADCFQYWGNLAA